MVATIIKVMLMINWVLAKSCFKKLFIIDEKNVPPAMLKAASDWYKPKGLNFLVLNPKDKT